MLTKIGISFLPRFLPVFLLFFIWIPVIDHYYVSTDTIDDEPVIKACHMPDDSVLDEINGFFGLSNKGSPTICNSPTFQLDP